MTEKAAQNIVSGGYSNTPPVNTVSKIDTDALIALVDWVGLTFSSQLDWKKLVELLHLDFYDFKITHGSNFGYCEKASYFGIIHIHYGTPILAREDMGIHLEISGQGCRYLESHWRSGFTWSDFFLLTFNYNLLKATRLDLAIDDFKQRLKIKTLFKKAESDELVTRFRNWKYFLSGDIYKKEKILGETLYIGSAKRIQFRFYNKLEERQSKGFAVNESIDSWQRYEVQVRHEQAHELMLAIANGGRSIGEIVKGLMAEYLSFRVRNKNDGNRSRWKECKFWTDFLNEVKPLHLSMQFPEQSLMRSQEWIIDQVSAILATVEEYSGREGLEAILKIGREKMTDKHFKLLENQRELDKLQQLQKGLSYNFELETFWKEHKQKSKIFTKNS
jgi:phage replication initiation protein